MAFEIDAESGLGGEVELESDIGDEGAWRLEHDFGSEYGGAVDPLHDSLASEGRDEC